MKGIEERGGVIQREAKEWDKKRGGEIERDEVREKDMDEGKGMLTKFTLYSPKAQGEEELAGRQRTRPAAAGMIVSNLSAPLQARFLKYIEKSEYLGEDEPAPAARVVCIWHV